MKKKEFNKKLALLFAEHEKMVTKPNKKKKNGNGVFDRYKRPVITAEHAPLHWRYDFDYETNPHLLERLGINAAFNAGAIYLKGKFYMVVRVEGYDRKSFFAVAESKNGIDNWRFWDYPIALPQTDDPETNVYDMRLTKHEDGWIYGVFCVERKDPNDENLAAAIAQCGIVRTKDLKVWERLDDLVTDSPQQRNCVLHPEFVGKKYAWYTRPADAFLDAGAGGGIGWGTSTSMEKAIIGTAAQRKALKSGGQKIINARQYHTITEVKNGQGPAPIKTEEGWLHLAHGVRNTAAGLRYVLYMFMTDLEDPTKVLYTPGGYFMAPQDEERVGDVSNVLFVNGWVNDEKGNVYIYYASSDTRMHVATTTVEKLLDYVKNTPSDALKSHLCVEQRIELINKNLILLGKKAGNVKNL